MSPAVIHSSKCFWGGKITQLRFFAIIAAAVLFLLAPLGCGSGSGGGGSTSPAAPSSESAVGHWYGTLYSNTSKVTSFLFALVSDDGIMRGIQYDSGSVYVGPVHVGGADMASTLIKYESSTYPFGSEAGFMRIRGTVLTERTMSCTYSSSSGNDSGDIYLSYNEDSHLKASSISIVSGSWTVHGTGDTITVDSHGEISGGISGCSIAGTISTKNSFYNTYHMNVTVSNCVYNGLYDGAADVVDTVVQNDSLEAILSNDINSLYLDLRR